MLKSIVGTEYDAVGRVSRSNITEEPSHRLDDMNGGNV